MHMCVYVCVCKREREKKRERALKYQCNVRHTNVGWPGFQQAPQVPNTARNTDGLWVIHRGASRDTNNLLQHVTAFFATPLILCVHVISAIQVGLNKQPH